MQKHIDCEAVPKVFPSLESDQSVSRRDKNDNKIHCKRKPAASQLRFNFAKQAWTVNKYDSQRCAHKQVLIYLFIYFLDH